MKYLDHRIFGRHSKFSELIKVLINAKNSQWHTRHICRISHAGAVKLMGEPIRQLGFDPSDENNWCDGKRAKYHVRVKGPKDKGCNSVTYKSIRKQIMLYD